ncbi:MULTISPECIES: glycoside hydrolase family 88 protein [unclassified Flavobacterium]|uniref:glycoside hydrolase family 88/105 protein n=1 Tax=unclassified Flavobacterium TaxID=196869 RepID=UPI00249292AF|nr:MULTISPECIES: glycoside hydrolase family 88 protein [unclassified Flavobacterium]MDQ1166265.1 unsaturated rhamnogalacturonyl hydrolase [Flavobacterium sp. SORGH_AS_0622]BDU26811.1 family 88 glycosyl hydrolase [Flavobacterium sp. GSB-24]
MKNTRKQSYLMSVLMICVMTFTSCKVTSQEPAKKDIVIGKNAKWSDKMALTLMKRHPEAYMLDDAKKPKWDYVHALVLHSIEELYKKNPDPRYKAYVRGYVDELVQADGTINTYEFDKYNIDLVLPGRLLFDVYESSKEDKYLKAMQLIRKQLTEQPRTQSGGFWHKQIYPNQMWLDGLYMGEPFYAEYTAKFENGKSFDDIAKQFELIQLHATDPKTGLLYHGWDESKQMPWADKQTGNSPNFWSRSLGWYVMALVDVLDYMPKDHPKQKELVKYLNNVSEALLKFQDKSGLWYQVTDKVDGKGNYLEASGSAMFSYAFAKGANKGYLPAKFKKSANKAFDGLTKVLIKKVDEDGGITLTNCCQVAGLGGTPYRDGSYEYYVNERKKDNDPKATGPFILAALELNR